MIEEVPVDTKADYKPDVYRALIGHLFTRGLMPREIERLFEDVFTILWRGGALTMTALNRTLQSLGWRENILDKISFRLIVYLLEKEGFHEVRKVSLH